MSNDLQRVLVALVSIPAALGLVWLGGLTLAILVAILAALGARELFQLARRTGLEPVGWLGIGLAALVPLATWTLADPGSGTLLDRMLGVEAVGPAWLVTQWPLLLALTPLLVLTVALRARGPKARPLEAAAVTLFAPLYCGVLLSAALVIRYGAGPERSWAATWLVFFPLAVTWICDTAAMWTGRLVGGPKLAPNVSPGKTRSGAIGGVAGGVLAAVVYSPLALRPTGTDLPPWQAAAVGAVLAVTAQVGDLTESLFKREAGVKDSGGLIPGHGGVLDRLDSLYFVFPVAAVFLRALGVL